MTGARTRNRVAPAAQVRVAERRRTVLAMLTSAGEPMSVAAITARMDGVSPSLVDKLLNQLLDEGLVERASQGRCFVWSLADHDEAAT